MYDELIYFVKNFNASIHYHLFNYLAYFLSYGNHINLTKIINIVFKKKRLIS